MGSPLAIQRPIWSIQVNVALVLDGSGSINSTNWVLEKRFAKDVVAAFAERNLFENGGTASYVQFDWSLESSGTFYSLESFNSFVDGDVQGKFGTTISIGIAEGRRLLNANDSSASFMIVITDGNDTSSDPSAAPAEADTARADGITIFAVGIGTFEKVGCRTISSVIKSANRFELVYLA